ncbi:hypothetical protein RHMOL_Rhmol07G0123300 [Rhododendron molle]|uniref:Uncharacterized protein n=1 Tax=Rhododendron molle TaxID=49168 RepID=A0ACC0N1U6_RHOML|nr:hypothetical protein RHMOL_Rhmol07G0123300 [Rhododendron molle]
MDSLTPQGNRTWASCIVLTACSAGGYSPGFVMRLEMKSGFSSSPVFGSKKTHPDLALIWGLQTTNPPVAGLANDPGRWLCGTV